jgi:uncharacterized protein with NRDE domain
MCLITFANRTHPDFTLLVAANRDEYYSRPTRVAHFWEDVPGLLAGRDLKAGGTWLGITRSGRFAAITNHRDPSSTPAQPRSRGMLTLDFLTGSEPAASYLAAVNRVAGQYAGFNLILADDKGLYYYSNIERDPRRLDAGIYSISNGLLDSDWPKQRAASESLDSLIPGAIDHARLAATVSNQLPVDDEALPDTGVGIELERALSAQFITTAEYGTRATTTLTIDHAGQVDFAERSFRAGGATAGQQRHAFSLKA